MSSKVIGAVVTLLIVAGVITYSEHAEQRRSRQAPRQEPVVEQPVATLQEEQPVQDDVHYSQTTSDAGRSIGYETIPINGSTFIQIESNDSPWIKL